MPKTDSARPLPPGWRRVKLGEVCEFVRGVSFDKSEMRTSAATGYAPILRAGNIGRSLKLDDDLVFVPARYVSKEQRLRAGDIAICMSSGSPEVVGKTAQLMQDWPGSVGAFCGILRAHDLDSAGYLAYWLRSEDFIAWRDGQARGANIQNLRFSQFAAIDVPWPPTPEQRRIAGILKEQLQEVEKARKATEAQLEAAKQLPAAYLREVFESEEAKMWPRKKLGDFCDFVGGMQPPKSTFRYQPAPGYVRLIQIQDYRTDAYAVYIREQDSDRRCTEQDIMVARYGGGGDTSSLFRILRGLVGAYNVALMKLVPTTTDVTLDYLYYALQLPDLRKEIVDKSARAIQSGFTKDDIGGLTIPFPAKRAQDAAATRLKTGSAGAKTVSRPIADQLGIMDKLPAALLRKAFSGEA